MVKTFCDICERIIEPSDVEISTLETVQKIVWSKEPRVTVKRSEFCKDCTAKLLTAIKEIIAVVKKPKDGNTN